MVGISENILIHEGKGQKLHINSSNHSNNNNNNNISNNIISDNYHTSDNHENAVDKCYQCILCPPMFFQRKKNQKRLWGLRVNTTSLASSSLEEQQYQTEKYQQSNGRRCIDQETSSFMNCCRSTSGSMLDLGHMYHLFCALAKKLKDSQIQTMCQAVENSALDGQSTHCVLVPRGAIEGEEPHVIACRIWRWPDLMYSDELKRIPSCPMELDPVYVCCNPSHWSRLSQAGNYKIVCLNYLFISTLKSLVIDNNYHCLFLSPSKISDCLINLNTD